MNLPIVPFNVAKDLKELGFDWDVPNKYSDNGKLNDATYSGDIKAPTQPEVCKWLRDEKELFVEVRVDKFNLHPTFMVDIYHFNVRTYNLPNEDDQMNTSHYDTYESAELAGIKKAIEILK